MIDIETHKIISSDRGIVYRTSSDKANPKVKQVSDRVHILKNLTDYATYVTDELKRLLNSDIEIEEENIKTNTSKMKKK